MLTYLASALPRFSSPTARLLALQCALRADGRGHISMPGGFLRGMRLASHAAPWHELEHAGWLRCNERRHGYTQAQILDAAVLNQAPGREERARAAHWTLDPAPLTELPRPYIWQHSLWRRTPRARPAAPIPNTSRACAQPPPPPW